MPDTPVSIESVFTAIERAGFAARGAFNLTAAERVGPLAEVGAIALVGVAGRQGWDVFAASPEARDGRADPLGRFRRRGIDGLADALCTVALYPFGGPPHWPFQRWTQRAEPVRPSPIGLLIHPTYGYRGALAFRDPLAASRFASEASPCATCRVRPCLAACTVGAFRVEGYDLAACATHLRRAAGADCMERGCRARRACPVGTRPGARARSGRLRHARFFALRHAGLRAVTNQTAARSGTVSPTA